VASHSLAGEVPLAHGYGVHLWGWADSAARKSRSEPRNTCSEAAIHWLGRKAESDAAMLAAEQKFGSDFPFSIACAHAYRGAADQAFAWLDRAYLKRDTGMIFIKLEPLMSLANDPL